MAERIVDGVIYDENFAKQVGCVSEEVKAPGNCAGNRSVAFRTKLMKRLEFRNPDADILEKYRKGAWSFTLNHDETVETQDYFLVKTVGYSDDYADVVPLSREAAFKWACDNMTVSETVREFPDLIRGGHSNSAEIFEADRAFKEREKAKENASSERKAKIAELRKELDGLETEEAAEELA